ncbi:hypothetical protein [Psychrobacter sp. KH172YL61]|uniref:hypothetical protein n=1 Tax=Psychrobacter sp. KH172YL61 TaxID=2517899 RepID=UPI001F08467E|nr:hypothetical protein [Psychrobacter sp. KH172YL61]
MVLDTIVVTSSADASADGLPDAYEGGWLRPVAASESWVTKTSWIRRSLPPHTPMNISPISKPKV